MFCKRKGFTEWATLRHTGPVRAALCGGEGVGPSFRCNLSEPSINGGGMEPLVRRLFLGEFLGESIGELGMLLQTTVGVLPRLSEW